MPKCIVSRFTTRYTYTWYWDVEESLVALQMRFRNLEMLALPISILYTIGFCRIGWTSSNMNFAFEKIDGSRLILCMGIKVWAISFVGFKI